VALRVEAASCAVTFRRVRAASCAAARRAGGRRRMRWPAGERRGRALVAHLPAGGRRGRAPTGGTASSSELRGQHRGRAPTAAGGCPTDGKSRIGTQEFKMHWREGEQF
jgi:hypothetical protein